VLVVTRRPWKLHFFTRQDGRLRKMAESSKVSGDSISISSMPLSFKLVSGGERPQIEVTRRESGQQWRA
jgi:hypothetical protein